MLVAQNSLGPVCPVPLTVRGIVVMSKHAAEYKKCGLKMEVVMIPDKCGREKTVGLRFLNKDGYNAPPV